MKERRKIKIDSKKLKLYKIGSWLVLITGIADIICTDLFRNVFLKIENQSTLFDLMQNTDVNFLGLERNALSIFNGFSLSTGVLLTFVGVFNLLFSKSNIDVAGLKQILLVNIILLLYFIFVCSVYLPIHGVFIALTTLVLFTASFVRVNKIKHVGIE